MEWKHGKEAFYELPDNHPDMKKVVALAPKVGRYEDREFESVVWDEENVQFLKDNYEKMTNKELGEWFGVAPNTIATQLGTQGLKRKPPKRKRVEMCNREGVVFCVFTDYYEAAAYMNVKSQQIYMAIYNNRTLKNFVWRYEDE